MAGEKHQHHSRLRCLGVHCLPLYEFLVHLGMWVVAAFCRQLLLGHFPLLHVVAHDPDEAQVLRFGQLGLHLLCGILRLGSIYEECQSYCRVQDNGPI